MNSITTFGTHSALFYYSLEHLYVNLVNYVKSGIENNQKIYIYIFPHIQKKIIEIFKHNNLHMENIVFKSFTELILLNSSNNFEEVNQTLDNMISDALSNGFSGISLIGQPSYAIQQTTKSDFLAFEQVLSKVFANKNGSILCIYDFYDLTHDKKYIDDSILKILFNTHTHIFSKFKMTKIEDFL